jgi:hypothetical protein
MKEVLEDRGILRERSVGGWRVSRRMKGVYKGGGV